MKVILLSFWFVEYTIELANALSETQHVILMLPRTKLVGLEGMVNPRVELITFHYPRLRYPTNLVMVYKIVKQIYKVNPDLIHLQADHPWFNLILPIVRKRYPLVATIHDVVYHIGDKASRRVPLKSILIKNASKIIVHGEFLKKLLVKLYSISYYDICTIPHGEFSIYKKFIAEEIPEESNSILFFGRIWEYKGLRYLIEAEPLLSSEIPEVKIIIAGEGENFKKYENMMIHKERFEVHNKYIDYKTIARLFQRAAVVVLPYIDASQSGVIPLAFSFNKPVIATNVGSISEVVIDGLNGILVPTKNPQALASAIIRLLKDENLRKVLGSNGFKMTRGVLSWKNIANRTIEVYQSVVNKRLSSGYPN